jgi:hypothetical protein
MSNTVQVLFRSYLPGSAGFVDDTGAPANNKQLVVAKMTATDTQSGTESLVPADLGLETIDFLVTNIEGGTGGVPAISVTTSVTAEYNRAGDELVISDVAAAGDRSAITNNEDPVIRLFAVGDSAAAPDLT